MCEYAIDLTEKTNKNELHDTDHFGIIGTGLKVSKVHSMTNNETKQSPN